MPISTMLYPSLIKITMFKQYVYVYDYMRKIAALNELHQEPFTY